MVRSPLQAGQEFGRLTVVRETPKRYRGKRIYECRCACGNTTEVIAAHLKSGNTKSCGCWKREQGRANGLARGRAVALAIEPGTTFGRLTVRRLLPEREHRQRMFECECSCGAVVHVAASALKRGDNRSCGCLNRDNRTKHGLGGHPLYPTWMSMRARCNNPNDRKYRLYGGRGIVVDPRWDDFAQFVADMDPKPSPRHTLDRIDGDGPYSPENCRWATPTEQARNIRPEARRIGERHPHAILRAADVLEIRLLSGRGVTHRQLAKRFGVATGTVSGIVARRSWRSI